MCGDIQPNKVTLGTGTKSSMTSCNHLPVNFDKQTDLTSGSHLCNDVVEELVGFLCKPHGSLTRAQKRSGQYIVDMFKYDFEKQSSGDEDADFINWLQDPKYDLQKVSENLDHFFFAGNISPHVSYKLDYTMIGLLGKMAPQQDILSQRRANIHIGPHLGISGRFRRRLNVIMTILHEQAHALLYLMPCNCATETAQRVDLVGLGHGPSFTKIVANVRSLFTSEFHLLLNSKVTLRQDDFISLNTFRLTYRVEWPNIVQFLGDLEPFLTLMHEVGLYQWARERDSDPVDWEPNEKGLTQRIGSLSYEFDSSPAYHNWLYLKRLSYVNKEDYDFVHQRWRTDEKVMDMFKRTGVTPKMRTYLSANKPYVRLRSLENFLTSLSRREIFDQAKQLTGETTTWKPILRSELSKMENPQDLVYAERGQARMQQNCEAFAYLERSNILKYLDSLQRRYYPIRKVS